jgi:glutamate-1-semialdehyde 2,1-aminomutase
MNDATTYAHTLSDTVARIEARYIAAYPKSREHYESATRTMPGANTRHVLYHDPFPVALVSGKGALLRDLDGHEYVDFLGEFTAGLYGHSDPVIKEAIQAVLSKGLALGGPNQYEAQLARLMVDRFPAVDLIRFCNSGTEANMMNISLARAVTKRPAVFVFSGSYHGGLFSFSGGKASPMNVPIDVVVSEFNNLEHSRDLIQENSSRLAAVIVEPVMGSAGCIPADVEFLRMLRDETDKSGIILIFDEVMTSRLAPGGLHEALGIMPDLVSFGKYLGGGVTFGAFGGRADLMERFDPRQPDALVHSGTYNNNVITMAAGIAGLSQVFTPDKVTKLNQLGDQFRLHLQQIVDSLGAPIQVTGQGSMICIHPQRESIKTPANIHSTPLAYKLIHLEMHLRGLYLARRGFMSLSLAITDRDLEVFSTAFKETIGEHKHVLA